MPLFMCSRCGVVEDTAPRFSNFWARELDNLSQLCSACDPDMRRWHNHFPRQSALGYFRDERGMIWPAEDVYRHTYPEDRLIVSLIDLQCWRFDNGVYSGVTRYEGWQIFMRITGKTMDSFIEFSMRPIARHKRFRMHAGPRWSKIVNIYDYANSVGNPARICRFDELL